jgi:hypothetical protein
MEQAVTTLERLPCGIAAGVCQADDDPMRRRYIRVCKHLKKVGPMPVAEFFFEFHPPAPLQLLPMLLVFRVDDHRQVAAL